MANTLWAILTNTAPWAGKALSYYAQPADNPALYQDIYANFEFPPLTALTGTATGSTLTSVVLAAGSSAIDGFYRFWPITLTSGPASGQTRRITAYVGATRQATVVPAWPVLPGLATYTAGNVSPAGWNGGTPPPTEAAIRAADSAAVTTALANVAAVNRQQDAFFTQLGPDAILQAIFTTGATLNALLNLTPAAGQTLKSQLTAPQQANWAALLAKVQAARNA